MKSTWSRIAAIVVLAALMLTAGLPVYASGTAGAQAAATNAASSAYKIGNEMSATILGVYNQADSEHVKLGAILRISNNGDATARIPDFEVRVTTAQGVTYTLNASSANVQGIQAMSEVETDYYAQINHPGALKLSTLSLVHVNYDVYPKQESTLLKAPIANLTWNGPLDKLTAKQDLLKWGTPFKIPGLLSPLTFTPVYYSQTYTNQGSAYMVQLLVSNPTDEIQTVPSFGLDGVADHKAYAGSRVEQQPVDLQPGEQQSIHYVINTDMDVNLNSLNVMLAGSYAAATPGGQSAMTNFEVGKLNIALPSESAMHSAADYTYRKPIVFADYNDILNPDMQISLVELHASPNPEDGTRTVLAKFKLNNTGNRPLPIPNFQAELWSTAGYSYTGTEQQLASTEVQAGTSYVVSYAFTMPASENSDQFVLELLGDKTSSPYKSRIAALGVQVQPESDKSDIPIYPYTLNIQDLTVVPKVTPTPSNAFSYSYQVKADLELQRDAQVVVDNSFSKLKFELYDSNGKLLGTQSFPFTGTNRLTSGYQTLNFSNVITDQSQLNVTLKVYESVTTPNGKADRLLYTYNQD